MQLSIIGVGFVILSRNLYQEINIIFIDIDDYIERTSGKNIKKYG